MASTIRQHPLASDMLSLLETSPPVFDGSFRKQLEQLLQWRRDVRRFRVDPVEESLIERLLDMAQFAPSVGNSQPWRWVRVESPELRQEIRDDFESCNASALKGFSSERAETYAKLKLEGLEKAPVQLVAFCDCATMQGHGLGQKTMPEMLSYSVAGMLALMWISARSYGLGMGWVSILNPQTVTRLLDVPSSWQLIAYLCLGWPVEDHLDPELERHHWQERREDSRKVIIR